MMKATFVLLVAVGLLCLTAETEEASVARAKSPIHGQTGHTSNAGTLLGDEESSIQEMRKSDLPNGPDARTVPTLRNIFITDETTVDDLLSVIQLLQSNVSKHGYIETFKKFATSVPAAFSSYVFA